MPNTIALHPDDRDMGRTDDLVQPFQIDRYGLRGRLVRLGESVDAVLDRHDYPGPVSELLGRAMALAACLASSVKYEGVFTLQAAGAGPVRTLVADVTSEGAIRGYVGFDREALDETLASDATPTVPRLFGGGHLSFTVDQGGERGRYQGIVELEGATLAECVHHYFRQSEQIDTAIHLACGKIEGEAGHAPWRASALMVQRLPEQRGEDQPELDVEDGLAEDGGSEEGWRRAVTFMGTASSGELLDPELTPNSLLFRLFHEDGVRVFEPRPIEDRCRCSRGRIERVLRSLPREEVQELKIEDAVVVTCEFCNRSESFTDSDLDEVYGMERPSG